MKEETFEAGEQVIITYTSQIICKLQDGRYLVRGFANPLLPDQLKKISNDENEERKY